MTNDVLTRRDIARSMAEDPTCALLALSPRAIDEHSQFVRRSLQRPDYAAAVALDQIPAWERALAMVATSVSWLRAVHAGWFPAEPVPDFVRLAYVPPEEPATPKDEDPIAWQREAAEISGYTYDPSWMNGGLSAAGASHVSDEVAALPGRVRIGLEEFASVEGFGGLPELAWYFSASAVGLGVSSNFDALVVALINGGKSDGSNGSAPTGPSPAMTKAAALQRRVMRRLGALSWARQTDIERAYSDRPYRRELVSEYGLGLAPLVAHAMWEAGEQTPGAGTLAALRRRLPPGAALSDKGPTKGQARQLAQAVLDAAHAEYRSHAGIQPPRPKGPPRRRGRTLRECADVGCRERVIPEVPRTVEVTTTAPSEAA